MTKSEVLQLMIFLQKFYRKVPENLDAMADGWAEVLEDYTYEELRASAKYHVRRSKFFPTLSELIDGIPTAIYAEYGIEEVRLSPAELARLTPEQRRIEELKAKYTRPFQDPPTVQLTAEDVAALNEFIDIDVEEGDER